MRGRAASHERKGRSGNGGHPLRLTCVLQYPLRCPEEGDCGRDTDGGMDIKGGIWMEGYGGRDMEEEISREGYKGEILSEGY